MIRRFLASIMTAFFLLTTLGTLAACNTIEGAGKDIEQGGKALRDEAREHSSRM